MIHRYIWSGLALLPTMVRGGIGNLNGIGWGRGILLAVLGGPVFAILGYAGFLLVPLGHGGVIQPSSGTLGGLFLATLVLRERLIPSRLVGALIIVCGLAVIRHRHMACTDHGVQRAGILDDFGVSRKDCEAMIMYARVKAGWIDGPLNLTQP